MPRFVLLLLSTLIVIVFYPQPGQAQSETVWSWQMLESDSQHLLVELSIPSFSVEAISHERQQFQRLAMGEEWSRWGEAGQPHLPTYQLAVGLPWPGTPEISIEEVEREVLSGYNVSPNPEFVWGGSPDQPEIVETFTLDAATYAQDTLYPGPLAEAAEPGFLREQALFQLRLYPFQYNPLRQELTVIRRMRVRVDFPPASAAPQTAFQARQNASMDHFAKMLEQVLVNYEALPMARFIEPLSSPTPGLIQQGINSSNATYVIITHPDFYEAVQGLATYRASRGESVLVVKSDDIYATYNGGVKSPEAIRNYLVDAYANWSTKPVYVVLVGDGDENGNNEGVHNPNIATDYIPSHYENLLVFGWAPLDVWYTKVHGNDDYPDLLIGRIPARTTTDVQTVIDKVQSYEQTPVPGEWMRRAVLVADDDSPGFAQDMENIAAVLPPSLTPTKQYSYDPASSVQDKVASGALVVAYSGHGSTTGWGGWSGNGNIFQQHQLNDLNNGGTLPFLTVANCSNGYFAEADRARVFAEEFLLLPDEGGIASWAPAAFSFPSVNTPMNQEMYKALFKDNDWTLASAATTALIRATAKNTHLQRNLFEAFTFFGDPALKLMVPPILTLGGQVSDNPVITGDSVTYTVNYQISGNTQAKAVKLVNTLPQHVAFQTASIAPSSVNGQILTWNLEEVAAGSYSLTITGQVSDAAGLVNGDTLSNLAQLTDFSGGKKNIQLDTTVMTTDTPPSAALYTSTPDRVGQVTTLTSISTGPHLTYSWNFGDGSPEVINAMATITHAYGLTGSYTARLTVSNGAGSDSATTLVDIVPAGAFITKPVAAFISSSPDKVGETTVFINNSQDGGDDAANLIYWWDFGDGLTSTLKSPNHIYSAPGSYAVQLTVTNMATMTQNSDSITNTVIIEPAPAPPQQLVFLPLILK